MTGERLDFGVLLAVAYSAFVDEMREELARAGFDDLNRSFGYVARAILHEPLTLRDLAARLGITSQGALKIVDDMEHGGYVERVPDAEDGRARRVRLAKRGRAAIAAARKFHARFESRLAARVGGSQVATLRSVLEAMVERRAVPGTRLAVRPV